LSKRSKGGPKPFFLFLRRKNIFVYFLQEKKRWSSRRRDYPKRYKALPKKVEKRVLLFEVKLLPFGFYVNTSVLPSSGSEDLA
jgi:hypothetical protein